MRQTAKAHILAQIRQNLKIEGDQADRLQRVKQRLQQHPRNTVPSRVPEQAKQQMSVFQEFCAENAMTIAEITSLDQVPQAVQDFLISHNQPAQIKATDEAFLQEIDWQQQPLLTVSHGACTKSDKTTISGCLAAIAETGTIMVHSGSDFPMGAAFFPDNHIVVIKESQITGWYEQAWDQIREDYPDLLPRQVTLVSGPSRTGDIEHKVQLGAHGPKKMHILLLKAH